MSKESEHLEKNGFVVIEDVVETKLLDAVLQNANKVQESITGKHFDESKPWEATIRRPK